MNVGNSLPNFILFITTTEILDYRYYWNDADVLQQSILRYSLLILVKYQTHFKVNLALLILLVSIYSSAGADFRFWTGIVDGSQESSFLIIGMKVSVLLLSLTTCKIYTLKCKLYSFVASLYCMGYILWWLLQSTDFKIDMA